MAKPIILILCFGNSCRSQIAEGILRQAAGEILDVRSAGSNPAGYVHPLAIKVMAEIGIDISAHRSKHVSEFLNENVETVISVCGERESACPVLPGQLNHHHWAFVDPVQLGGSEKEKLESFRSLRDEMRRVFQAYAAGRKDAAGIL